MFGKGKGTGAGAGGVAALNKKALDDTMEDGVVVVAFEAKLDEVADCFWGLFGPELDVQWAIRCVQYDLAFRRWLEHVYRRH